MTCAVCTRQERGPMIARQGEQYKFCSMRCMNKFKEVGLIDPTPQEEEALWHGGQMLGEYLEEIGVFDVRQMSVEQYKTCLRIVYGNTCEKLHELSAKDKLFLASRGGK